MESWIKNLEDKWIYKQLIFDKEAIKNLYLDNQWYAYTNDLDTLFEGIQHSLDVIGVYDKDSLIGLIRTVGDTKTIIYIQDILILKNYQQKGIGTKLMNIILNKYQNVRQICLMTDETSEARTFYEKLGLVSFDKKNCVGYIKK